MSHLISRRTMSSGMLGSWMCPASAFSSDTHNNILASAVEAAPIIDGKRIAPLYVVAYVDPSIESQKNQESVIARYPIAIVPQDNRASFVSWRNRILHINPDIIYLAYQMTIETTTVPGPGHDVLRRVNLPTSFVRTSSGSFLSFGSGRFRLYDPRSKEWQKQFIEACLVTLETFPFRGIFLDQCSIFRAHTTSFSERQEMISALAQTLRELRKYAPRALIVANSPLEWPAINGEMSEGDISRFHLELQQNADHIIPEINMALVLITGENEDISIYGREMRIAFESRALFSASYKYQNIKWFPLYDDIKAACR
jgi:hypothetical protein